MTTLLSDVISDIRSDQGTRPGPARPADGATAGAVAPTRPTTAAHVAPFHLAGLARALRPRTSRGRHVSASTGARHRGLPAAAAPPRA